MLHNNNSAVVKRLAGRSIRTSRMRTVFAIAAIMLTTLLITALFTVGMSMLKSLEYSTARQVGSMAHGSFKHITPQQFEALYRHEAIREYGISILVGIATNPELAKRQVQLQYMDANNARYSFVTPLLAGAMPAALDDIVLDTITLDLLGLEHKLGQRVSLGYEVNGNVYSSEFILSGYFLGDRVSMASLACVSQPFVEQATAGMTAVAGAKAGLINLDVMLSNSVNIEGRLTKIILDSGVSLAEVDIGVNWAYLGSDLLSHAKDLWGAVGLLLLIMLSGYLMIYNIFNIAVVKDTRFYGLLKTVGTTPRQIRKLVARQATTLCVVGIPLGLVVGYMVGAALTPVVLSATTVSYTAQSFSPAILVGAAVFAYLTVLISTRNPARLAGRVSPVEAIRYSGTTSLGKRTVKRSTHGAKLYRMALTNLFRNKSRVVISILSLALSIILFNTIYGLVSGFDLNKFLAGVMGTDFSVADASFYRWTFNPHAPNALSPELYAEMAGLTGITSADRIFYSLGLLPGSNNTPLEIYGVDPGVLKLMEQHIVAGAIDHERFAAGDYLIVKGGNLRPGDSISLEASKDEYTVMAVVEDLPLYLYSGRTYVGGVSVYLPSAEFVRLTEKPSLMTALFSAEADSVAGIERYLKQKTAEISGLDYRSKSLYMQEYRAMVNTFNITGYALSFVLAVIGLLNFANVVITSIVLRRQEFAAMQSIGLTTRQLRLMLASEGMYYALFAGACALALGGPIAYFGIRAVAVHMAYFTYRFSVLPILLSVPALAVIAVLIPMVAYSSTCETSVVERLREIG